MEDEPKVEEVVEGTTETVETTPEFKEEPAA